MAAHLSPAERRTRYLTASRRIEVGQRPVAIVERKYEWVYGLLHPGSGHVIWFLPKMNAVVMAIALKRFAEEAEATAMSPAR